MPFNDLFTKKKLRFVMFGGKGGVGKTSCAAAASLYTAQLGNETLIVSTDPAHSLSDSFDQKLTGEATSIKGIDGLYALEIDPSQAMQEFRTAVDDSDASESLLQLGLGGDMFDMTPPGIDEAIAFNKVLEFLDSPQYDVLILDTAPTGHTLRLLSLPEVMDSWLFRIITLRQRMSNLFDRFKQMFGRGGDRDQSLESLEEMKEKIARARSHLTNPEESEFVIVMIPEKMSIYESERLLRSLFAVEVPSEHIIVNMIYPEQPSCSFCSARRTMQNENLELIDEYYDDFTVAKVPLFEQEIRGLDNLQDLAQLLFENEQAPS